MKAERDPLSPSEYVVIRSLPHQGTGRVELVESEIFGHHAVRKYIDLFGLEDAIPYQEPRLLDEIKHPRIVRVAGARFGELHGMRVVVFDMPYYQEGSVLTALEDGDTFSILDAIRITNDALDALQYVHEQLGYVHRDVKPSNLLLAEGRRRALVSDFGSAARLENGSCRALGGSLVYRAPEYHMGRLTPAADVYSLGLVLHEMLSGALPYATLDPETLEGRLTRGLRAPTDAQLDDAAVVPRGLRRIVHRATYRDLQRRYRSAAAFRSALTGIPVIDWRRVGDGWEGKDSGSPRRYRVMEQAVSGDRVRLTALRNIPPTATWRRFSVPDGFVPKGDREASRAYFDEVVSVALSR